MKATVHIGTSGWYYKDWHKVFYPEDLPINQRLHFYAEHFNTVEINTTFYHMPKESTVKNWDAQVVKKFLFSVKASQYITHLKRLKDCGESLAYFYKRILFLKDKLGPILFQLPPSFKKDMQRIEQFIDHLDKKLPSVFEFRHPSWFCDEVYDLLKKHKIALCLSDLGGHLSPLEITSHFTYIRLHGPHDSYTGSYSAKNLNEWKKRILQFSQNKISTYCYFDNDAKGNAIKDANVLKRRLAAEGFTV